MAEEYHLPSQQKDVLNGQEDDLQFVLGSLEGNDEPSERHEPSFHTPQPDTHGYLPSMSRNPYVGDALDALELDPIQEDLDQDFQPADDTWSTSVQSNYRDQYQIDDYCRQLGPVEESYDGYGGVTEAQVPPDGTDWPEATQLQLLQMRDNPPALGVLEKGPKFNVARDASRSAQHQSTSQTQASMPMSRNWNQEFQSIMDRLDQRHTGDLETYTQLKHLAHDFVSVAKMYGKIIITELPVPAKDKTIKPWGVGGEAGGEKYICQGIVFKLAINWKRLYPSDEYASKAAGHDLKGLIAFHRCQVHPIRLPMMCLIDYRGYRLVAQSLLPIGTHTLVYGSSDVGASRTPVVDIHLDDSSMNRLMAIAAVRLHLKGHIVGRNRLIHGPVDIEGHIGEDGRYYLIDFHRLMPPEYPKPDAVGANLYELLRPELVRAYVQPLSSDACSKFGRDGKAVHDAEIRQATSLLYNILIPKFSKWLCDQAERSKESELLELFDQLTEKLHMAGINVRHLGRVRARCDPDAQVVRHHLLMEMIARCLKNHLRAQWRQIIRDQRMLSDGPFHSAVRSTLNTLVGNVDREKSRVYWNDDLKKDLTMRFPWALTAEEQSTEHDLRADFSPSDLALVFRRLEMMKLVVFSDHALNEFRHNPARFEFVDPDIPKIKAVVGRMHLIEHADGNALLLRSRQTSGPESDRLLTLATQKFQLAVQSTPDDWITLNQWGSALYQQALVLAERRFKGQVSLDGEGTRALPRSPRIRELFEQAQEKFNLSVRLQRTNIRTWLAWGHLLCDLARVCTGLRLEESPREIMSAAGLRYRQALELVWQDTKARYGDYGAYSPGAYHMLSHQAASRRSIWTMGSPSGLPVDIYPELLPWVLLADSDPQPLSPTGKGGSARPEGQFRLEHEHQQNVTGDARGHDSDQRHAQSQSEGNRWRTALDPTDGGVLVSENETDSTYSDSDGSHSSSGSDGEADGADLDKPEHYVFRPYASPSIPRSQGKSRAKKRREYRLRRRRLHFSESGNAEAESTLLPEVRGHTHHAGARRRTSRQPSHVSDDAPLNGQRRDVRFDSETSESRVGPPPKAPGLKDLDIAILIQVARENAVALRFWADQWERRRARLFATESPKRSALFPRSVSEPTQLGDPDSKGSGVGDGGASTVIPASTAPVGASAHAQTSPLPRHNHVTAEIAPASETHPAPQSPSSSQHVAAPGSLPPRASTLSSPPAALQHRHPMRAPKYPVTAAHLTSTTPVSAVGRGVGVMMPRGPVGAVLGTGLTPPQTHASSSSPFSPTGSTTSGSRIPAWRGGRDHMYDSSPSPLVRTAACASLLCHDGPMRSQTTHIWQGTNLDQAGGGAGLYQIALGARMNQLDGQDGGVNGDGSESSVGLGLGKSGTLRRSPKAVDSDVLPWIRALHDPTPSAAADTSAKAGGGATASAPGWAGTGLPHPGLAYIDLSEWSQLVQDPLLEAIALHALNAVVLSVARCPYITESVLLRIADQLTALQCIDLTGCPAVTDAVLWRLLSTCPHLQTLCVSHAPNIGKSRFKPGLVSGDPQETIDQDTQPSRSSAAQHQRGADARSGGLDADFPPLPAAPAHGPVLAASVVPSTAPGARPQLVINVTPTAKQRKSARRSQSSTSGPPDSSDYSSTDDDEHDEYGLTHSTMARADTIPRTIALTHLDLSVTHISEAALCQLLTLAPRLRSLNLESCHAISRNVLRVVTNTCTALQALNVSHSRLMNDEMMSDLAAKCTQLRQLHIRACHKVTEAGLNAFVHKDILLQELDISKCANIAAVAIGALGRQCGGDLRHLNLSHCDKLNSLALKQCLEGALNLRKLILDHMPTSLNAKSLEVVGLNCDRLISLSLRDCGSFVTDANLQQIALMCPDLQEVYLNRAVKLSNTGVGALGEHLTKLRVLSLDGVTKITDASVTEVVVNNPNLVELNLIKCEHITDATLQALAQNCPGMRLLWLESNSKQITSVGIRAVATACPNLRKLFLACLTQIDDDGLFAVGAECPLLEDLNVRKSRQITNKGIEAVLRNCICLRKLNVQGSKNIKGKVLTQHLARYAAQLDTLILDEHGVNTDDVLRAHPRLKIRRD